MRLVTCSAWITKPSRGALAQRQAKHCSQAQLHCPKAYRHQQRKEEKAKADKQRERQICVSMRDSPVPKRISEENPPLW